ncbi:MAG: ACP S-malonyltransferase [Proteobacteria bacterium]|nr:ACP S-malonyltransferase [Pseudomonadota bacterium]MBU1389813.1 ACP S-malonyltransferase [Pseudomonadota bacterium]MBU1543822.1 ACP S-malonyltransferase [Pseudomonadota bacterium]MBU2430408.1 ACP S-malonyltransferase [Pseudomonadota bacterium]MBU2483036.1 ACP S-malonyltransferase [Pseudomonadota bacterium]
MSNTLTAVVFPGQGSQRKGMGKDFFDTVAVSRSTYEEASQALGWDVARCCFEENDHLDMTQFSQPCILTTQIAMLRGLESVYGFKPQFFGGHSLGEYTALVAAGVMPFVQAVKAVQVRGQLMQAAVPPGVGAMAAVIVENLDVDHLCEVLETLNMDAANINSSSQVVISGEAARMDIAQEKLAQILGAEAMRFVLLNVSAPFHSRFMRPVEAEFRQVLEAFADTLVLENASKVLSNFTGNFHTQNKHQLMDNLVFQLSNPVRWTDNMTALSQKTRQIFEIGPDRPLRGFFKSMGLECTSITRLSAAERAFVQ